MARGVRNKKIEAVEAQATLDAVKTLDSAKVISDVNNLQVSIQSTLADVSASITNKIQQMDTIDSAIKLKEQRLKELYGIEAEAVSIDDLKAQRAEEVENWNKDREARSVERDLEIEDRNTERKRTEDEWKYNFAQQQKRAADELVAQTEANKRAETVRATTLAKDWADREAALKARETEQADLKKQVEGIDARIKSEVAKAEAILTNSLNRSHGHEVALLKKDAEAAKSLCDTKTLSLETANTSLREQIEEMRGQLLAARQDAKDISTSALQASSDRKVAEALRQVVDSRDNVTSKSGK